MKKATDEQIIDAYRITGSVWAAGERLGMCGQTVHERLVKLDAIKRMNYLSEHEKALIEDLYRQGFLSGDGQLDSLARSIGRTKSFVCRYAHYFGFTELARKSDAAYAKSQGPRISAQWREGGHPRGMLGKHHSIATKQRLSQTSTAAMNSLTVEQSGARSLKILKTRFARFGTVSPPRHGTSWKSGWRTVGGQRFFARSMWEANYARYLELLKQKGHITKWEHEPVTFWFEKIKTGTRCYLPDFRVTTSTGSVEFHEVKGWMDAKSKTKIKRMRIYHPTVVLKVLDAKWYRANSETLRSVIPDWEVGRKG